MKRFFGYVTLCMVISTVLGQIANIESKRTTKKEEGLSGTLDLTFSYVKNVDEVLQYGGNISAYYFNNRHSILLLLESAMIKAEGEELVNNNFEHVRYNYELGKERIIAWEVFEQLQQNRVQDIRLRLLTGTGLRFKLSEKDSLKTNFGISGMYEYEVADKTDLTESHIRGSSYLSLSYQISKNSSLNFIGYYQPLITDLADYRVSSELNLRFNIIKKLAFRTRVSIIYDSAPLPDIPHAIINVSNGLSISF